MTPALLTRAGVALYGRDFKGALADDLGVTSATVRRWCSGREAIPDGLRTELLALFERRQAEVDCVIRKLEQ